jgi:hypothetical protein
VPEPNGVERTIEAAGGVADLAKAWNVSRQFLYQCQRKGFFPEERALDAHQRFGIPIRDLVAPGVRDTIDRAMGDEMLG